MSDILKVKSKFLFMGILLMLWSGVLTAAPDKKIVFLGDSLTEGYGIDQEKAFPAILQNAWKKEGRNLTVLNSGISGSTSSSLMNRLNWILKSPPDIIVLELGANDGLRGVKIEETKKNLSAGIKSMLDKRVKVILLGVTLPPNYGGKYINEFEQMFKDLSRQYKIPLDPFFIKSVAGKKDLNLPDGIHPNEKGHQLIAMDLKKFLDKNI